MEIISYVGGRPDNRQKRTNSSFYRMSKKLKKRFVQADFSFKPAKNRGISEAISISKPFSLPKLGINVKKITSAVKRYWWILPFAVLLGYIPVAVNNVIAYSESRTNPLQLSNNVETELDILNKEMARFALSTSIDVEEDGTLSGNVVSYSFKEPVTFTNYTVKSGDTISGITLKYKLNNISTIIAVNKIDNVRALNAGKTLKIPSVDGLIYKVSAGDSVKSISNRYGIEVEDILDVNDLDTELLSVGQELFIPGAKLDKDVLRRAMGDTFINPLKTSLWRLTSRCGWRADPFTGVKQYHNGLDMAISQGTPIYAALSGKIAASGWSNVYGNYVIIDHGNGYQSLYGHMYKKLCTLNQEVSTGTKIGLVGSTGYSTGPHLHFTVYKNGKVVDPLTLIK